MIFSFFFLLILEYNYVKIRTTVKIKYSKVGEIKEKKIKKLTWKHRLNLDIK